LSRRAADKAIEDGHVIVDGEVVTRQGLVIDPSINVVEVKGKKLEAPKEFIYIMFHKPRGYLVTKSDPKGRPTIWDLLKDIKSDVNSVGRLDFDSEGLLLLTNDGKFLYALTHPKHEVWKLYQVKVKGIPSADSIAKLKEGVDLEDGKTAPSQAKIIKQESDGAWMEISIREGKYRQIRRMCEAVGHKVIRLRRIGVGSLRLERLKVFERRNLKPLEVHQLLEACSK
jgi:pseudouridine synthase